MIKYNTEKRYSSQSWYIMVFQTIQQVQAVLKTNNCIGKRREITQDSMDTLKTYTVILIIDNK